MLTILPRILLILLGILVIPFAIATAKGGKFRRVFYIWDNEEDGYTGDKLGWYSNYKGRSLTVWDHYVWSALRNPCFNLRYVPWFSCDTIDVTDVQWEGNSYNKRYEWSFDKERKKIWFNFSCVADGKKRKMSFVMFPISKTHSFKAIWGWKFYPRHYLDQGWVDKIKKEGFPPYKDRAIFTFGVSVKKDVNYKE